MVHVNVRMSDCTVRYVSLTDKKKWIIFIDVINGKGFNIWRHECFARRMQFGGGGCAINGDGVCSYCCVIVGRSINYVLVCKTSLL